MKKFFASLLLLCLATIGCKEYSTGLEKSTSRADETSAIATLRTIAQAQTTYSITNAGHYATFEQLAEGGLLDSRFNHSNPEYHGYSFSLQTNDSGEPGYSCNADPASTSHHGGRHFYIDSTSTDIRVNATQPASSKDEILRP